MVGQSSRLLRTVITRAGAASRFSSLASIKWGRPAQQIGSELNVNRDVRDLSTEELMAIVAAGREAGGDEP